MFVVVCGVGGLLLFVVLFVGCRFVSVLVCCVCLSVACSLFLFVCCCCLSVCVVLVSAVECGFCLYLLLFGVVWCSLCFVGLLLWLFVDFCCWHW